MLKTANVSASVSFYHLDTRGKDRIRRKVIESDKSQTGSGFIPALSNHLLSLYHSPLPLICRNIKRLYEHLHHPPSSSIVTTGTPHHPSSSSTADKLTFKSVEIHLCSSPTTHCVNKIDSWPFLQSFTHCYVTWISPSFTSASVWITSSNLRGQQRAI